MEQRKICQSCAMPIEDEAMRGHEADDTLNEDYCMYCYDKGAFTNDSTMEEMIAFCAPLLVKEGVSKTEEEATAMMNGFFPQLKRWAK